MNLTKTTIIERLVKDISQWLDINNFIYRKSSQMFVKRGVDYDQNIYIDLFTWDAGKSWNLNFQVHVRIHQIENILNRYKPHVSKTEAKKTSTVAKSIINLCQEDPFLISTIADIVSYNDKIESRLEQFAIPYLNKYSNISLIEKSFDLDESNWPTRDIVAKCEILIAISIIQNDKKKFSKLVEECEILIKEYRSGFFVPSFQNMISAMKKDYFI